MLIQFVGTSGIFAKSMSLQNVVILITLRVWKYMFLFIESVLMVIVNTSWRSLVCCSRYQALCGGDHLYCFGKTNNKEATKNTCCGFL
jgi:hypothetical protein